MTLNQQAETFWKSNDPSKRFEYVPGFNAPVYDCEYSELEPDEKQKVRDMMRDTRE